MRSTHYCKINMLNICARTANICFLGSSSDLGLVNSSTWKCFVYRSGFTCDTAGLMQSRRWRSRQQIAKDLLPRHLALSVDFIALVSLRMYIYSCPNAGGDPVRRSCARKQTSRLVLELQINLWRGHLCLRLRCYLFSGAGRMCVYRGSMLCSYAVL